MTTNECIEKIKEFFYECTLIAEKKGRDYNPGGIAFKNVRELAEEIDVSDEKIIWIAMAKHISSIKSYIKLGKLESEPIRERLKDLANYAALLAVLIEENESTKLSKIG